VRGAVTATKVDADGVSHPGKVRKQNEDHFLVGELRKSLTLRRTSLPVSGQTDLAGETTGHLFLVADGMSDAANGEVASELAVFTAVEYVLATLPWFFGARGGSPDDVREDLVAMVKDADSVVRSAAVGQPGKPRMGTTLAVAYLIGLDLFVTQVGDSRCYVLRGSELRQLTRDDTVTQELVEEGRADPKQDEVWGFGNSLTEVVGGEEQGVYPEVTTARVDSGDTILLCTDGLTRHVTDREIATVLSADEPASTLCQRLIEAANEAGGSDNITVVVGRVLAESDG
jgi:protein phosphatase